MFDYFRTPESLIRKGEYFLEAGTTTKAEQEAGGYRSPYPPWTAPTDQAVLPQPILCTPVCCA
jgi:hypothetical protein